MKEQNTVEVISCSRCEELEQENKRLREALNKCQNMSYQINLDAKSDKEFEYACDEINQICQSALMKGGGK